MSTALPSIADRAAGELQHRAPDELGDADLLRALTIPPHVRRDGELADQVVHALRSRAGCRREAR